MKGIEIAKRCGVSTSTLKHYEKWGLVPDVPKAENGYRQYTLTHLAYFQCVVHCNIGFGMPFVKQIMPLIQTNDTMSVLWKINEAQSALQDERRQAEQVVDMLEVDKVEWFEQIRKKKKYYSIGEVADIAGIAASAIRHWEAEKLIEPERHKDSGYRQYSPEDIRRILIIRTVSKAVWSLDSVREVLTAADQNNIKRTKEMAMQSLDFIDQTLVARMKAIASLSALLDIVSSHEDGWSRENLGYYGYYQS
ncbi:MAG: MerR family transcriptional regulator [Alkalibacterium sp.]|nr:MerR family transcriptional regulator [Alkalibacterium sp.]